MCTVDSPRNDVKQYPLGPTRRPVIGEALQLSIGSRATRKYSRERRYGSAFNCRKHRGEATSCSVSSVLSVVQFRSAVVAGLLRLLLPTLDPVPEGCPFSRRIDFCTACQRPGWHFPIPAQWWPDSRSGPTLISSIFRRYIPHESSAACHSAVFDQVAAGTRELVSCAQDDLAAQSHFPQFSAELNGRSLSATR